MNKIFKCLIFDGKMRVYVIDSMEALRDATNLHKLSPLASSALGRVLTIGAYIGANLKGANSKYNLTINGNGELGKIVVQGESDNTIRGYIQNPNVDIENIDYNNVKLGTLIGSNGDIRVVKDLGLKEPYVGSAKLVNGEIGDDFASYLLHSEGIKSAVAVGAYIDVKGVKTCGGLIVEAMPDATEEMIFLVEDIISEIGSISKQFLKRSGKEIMDFYFGHLECQILESQNFVYKCKCSKNRIDGILKGIGQKEVDSIVNEHGFVEVRCDFCSTKYIYQKDDVISLFRK